MKLAALILFILMNTFMIPQADKYTAARNEMVQSQIISRGVSDHAIISAMRKVPRHLFVPKESIVDAYGDYPVSIGFNQTISQPYIVAYMTEAVRPNRHKRALEIGTGSGYQAAVLAEIIDTVYTIEIIPELAKQSTKLFNTLGYKNIIGKAGDGYHGWQEHAPFDIIVVTAAADAIPKPLIDQLADNGRLVIPVGDPGATQELILLIKKNGKTETKRLTFVRFVPFIRSAQ